MNLKAFSYTLILLSNLIVINIFAQINFERNDSVVVLETNGDTLKNGSNL